MKTTKIRLLTICILALGCASEAPTGPEPVSERPATLLEPEQRSVFSRLRARDLSARRVVTSRRPTLVSALP